MLTRTRKWVVRSLAGVGIATLLALSPCPYYISLPLRVGGNAAPSDAIVLLSHNLIDKTWLSLEGTQRTSAAVLLFKKGFAPYVVSSGSSLRVKPPRDEAALQAVWLATAGVPEDRIIIERASSRTYESVVEIKKLSERRGWKSLVIVASEMDVPRIRAVFHKLGGEENVTFEEVPEFARPQMPTLYYSHGWEVLSHAAYEYAGLAYYWWRGWI